MPRQRPPSVVCGRKFCTRCGRWRLLVDFYARRYDQDGNAVWWQSCCMNCGLIEKRISNGIIRRGRPYEARKPPLTPEQRKARTRELYQCRRRDPQWLERRREYERIWREAKRREQGVPARALKRAAP